MFFSINGEEFANLKIIDYKVKLQPLEGENSGRSKSVGRQIIREPQGILANLKITFAATDSKNEDFTRLWRFCRSMGTEKFVSVSFIDPADDLISQDMMLSAAELQSRRIDPEAGVLSGALSVEFTAARALNF